MRRIFLLISIVLLTGLWATAQLSQYGGGYDHWGNYRTTLQGCLQGSPGNYVVTDRTGTTFKLTGNTAGFHRFVDHKVRLVGRTSYNPNHPEAMGGDIEKVPTLHVFRLKHASQSVCQ
jgi:hypothetical protein